MKIIDSHVHLYPEPDINKEFNISQEPVNTLLFELSQKLKINNIDLAVVYLLDKRILTFNKYKIKIPKNLIISTIVGIQDYTDIVDIRRADKKGIKIIKILPYEQKILRSSYNRVLDLAEFAEEKNMVLTICSTYGSKLLYETNGIELATLIKKKYDIPIILAHGGGPKILDAMSVMLEYDDIFLDLSFSLKFWWDSSIIKDYAFALKKLGSKRCFYGSDYPYVKFDESLYYFNKFIKKYNFSDEAIENILHINFEEFERKYL